MQPTVNVDARETEKFSALAARWWDPKGPMHTLHAVNPLRTGFIARSCEVRERNVLDIGCGGGVLAESLTRLGARVTGIDLSQDLWRYISRILTTSPSSRSGISLLW